MIMKKFYPNYTDSKIKASRNPLNQLELNFEFVDQESEDRLQKDRYKFMNTYRE